MQGAPDSPGVLRLAASDIFARINGTPDRDFLIRVSYVEIYNEVRFAIYSRA